MNHASHEEGSPFTHSQGDPSGRRPWVRPLAFAVAYIALGALIVGVLYMIVQIYGLTDSIRSTQKGNTTTIKNSQETLDVVKDCTQPNGACYQDGQKRTGKAVQDISEATTQASIYAAYCVHTEPSSSVAAIERCVNHQFEIARANH